MAFGIKLLDEDVPATVGIGRACFGCIQLGGFSERFAAALDYWRRQDYERQWARALPRAVRDGQVSALITSMADPSRPGIVHWWPLYPLGSGEIAVQNHLVLLSELHEAFDPTNPYQHVRIRRVVDEDGNAISEWHVSRADVELFLAGIR